MSTTKCRECNGGRLRKESLAVHIYDAERSVATNIDTIVKFSIQEALSFFNSLKLTQKQEKISQQIIKEIKQRLQFLLNVGLDYLTLDRSARTLSGGEAQRIRLATQIGSQLVGVLYVLDEPSIGLHQRDNLKLIRSLQNLRDLGNTVIVVEHDKAMIKNADFIVDLGPGAGEQGGHVIATGKPQSIIKENENNDSSQSLTGLYLCERKSIEIPASRRKGI
jgi:excinuclease ABC subunit A